MANELALVGLSSWERAGTPSGRWGMCTGYVAFGGRACCMSSARVRWPSGSASCTGSGAVAGWALQSMPDGYNQLDRGFVYAEEVRAWPRRSTARPAPG